MYGQRLGGPVGTVPSSALVASWTDSATHSNDNSSGAQPGGRPTVGGRPVFWSVFGFNGSFLLRRIEFSPPSAAAWSPDTPQRTAAGMNHPVVPSVALDETTCPYHPRQRLVSAAEQNSSGQCARNKAILSQPCARRGAGRKKKWVG